MNKGLFTEKEKEAYSNSYVKEGLLVTGLVLVVVVTFVSLLGIQIHHVFDTVMGNLDRITK